MPRALGEQFGKCAASRSNLDDRLGGRGRERVDDAAEDAPVV
jgi:hypothetical protein